MGIPQSDEAVKKVHESVIWLSPDKFVHVGIQSALETRNSSKELLDCVYRVSVRQAARDIKLTRLCPPVLLVFFNCRRSSVLEFHIVEVVLLVCGKLTVPITKTIVPILQNGLRDPGPAPLP